MVPAGQMVRETKIAPEVDHPPPDVSVNGIACIEVAAGFDNFCIKG
jgi:hypothetical protein